jgi:hypothetical protein
VATPALDDACAATHSSADRGAVFKRILALLDADAVISAAPSED